MPKIPCADTLQPGEQFSHYRVVQRLGGGGMGTVFEAEDLESGRRVALKVLSHALDSPEGRERFLREGRLAASINHPNSVYVFGTEEVCGIPVIAMELVTGGTLEERVRIRGPMPSAEAVDAVLQIISGLEAAQRIGILHRDVKPSNCFIDVDGTVKIGDFGLSISTALRTEPALTTSGAFLGTPGFCSPEQLRGEELNVRSDIYAVGVTLFYLLTGRTPFEVKNVVALIATVLEQPAPSPRKLRSNVPHGLARAVQRCLAKDPGDRFQDYAELRQALEPYSSAAPVPARLPLRAAAGVLDMLLLSTIAVVAMAATSFDLVELLGQVTQNPWKWLGLASAGIAGTVLYYTVGEGLWGATVGKFVCRMRVIGAEKSAPGIPRALVRAAIFVIVPVVPFWCLFGANGQFYVSGSILTQMVPTAMYYGLLALLFCTARKRNGQAGLHDLASGTRVILRTVLQSRAMLPLAEPAPPGAGASPRIGPYHVLETLEITERDSWVLAYDLRLLRKVWVHVVPPGTPPVAPHLRNLGRIGRLRWLTGIRSPGENWDAFEAATGRALVTIIREGPQSWAEARFWLSDLARELNAAEKDRTTPEVLALNRVWITSDGRAKLLDFLPPGLRATEANESATTALVPPAGSRSVKFLEEVASAVLSGKERSTEPSAVVQVRLPLHAREFLGRLPGLPSAEAVSRALGSILHRPAIVTRSRRAAIVGGCLALPALAIFAGLFGLSVVQKWDTRYPGLMQLSMLLNERWTRPVRANNTGPTDRQIAIYISSHFRQVVTNKEAWSNLMAQSLIKGESRQFAEESILQHPAPDAVELKEAERVIEPRLPKTSWPEFRTGPFFLLLIFAGAMAFYVALPAVLAALSFRGGLILLIAGVSFVRRDGATASRPRLLWRSLLAWAPVLPLCMLAAYYLQEPLTATGLLTLLIVCAPVLISMSLPERGVADRLAGTWPVPR